MAESEPMNLTLEEVKDFLTSHDGKVKNAILVLHFKKYFHDPVTKGTNKERFKQIVNELAVVKTEQGEKYIVLKKKFRARPLPSLDSITSLDSVTSGVLNFESDSSSGRRNSESSSDPKSGSISREQSMEPLSDQSRDASRASSVDQSRPALDQSTRSDETGYEADASRESSIAPEDASINEVSPIVSVKDRAKVLNKMSERPPEPTDYRMLGKIGKTQAMLAEEAKTVTVSLIDPVEREWMIVAAKCDYMRMMRMLQEHPELARRKDYANGYSCLHWACKHGNQDAVKLLAGSYKSPVNARTHGGYTPLHLAAMQGDDDMMELLIKTYGADTNIRDFRGRKAKQYMQNSAARRNMNRGNRVQHTVDLNKRASRITAEDVDAAIKKKAGADVSHQGIGSFLNPQSSNLRASFRINNPKKQLSPTMMRRGSSSKNTSGSDPSDREMGGGRNRPISVPVGVPKSQSDSEILEMKSSLV